MAIELSPGIIDLIRIEGKGALVPVPLVVTPTKPAKPVLSFGTITYSSIQLVLSSAKGADTVRLEVSQDESSWTSITANLISSFNHSGLGAETTWYYRPVAVNAVGETVGDVRSATTLAEDMVEPPDGTLDYFLTPTSTSIHATITSTGGAESFQIRYREVGGSFSSWVPGTSALRLKNEATYEVELRGVVAGVSGDVGPRLTAITLASEYPSGSSALSVSAVELVDESEIIVTTDGSGGFDFGEKLQAAPVLLDEVDRVWENGVLNSARDSYTQGQAISIRSEDPNEIYTDRGSSGPFLYETQDHLRLPGKPVYRMPGASNTLRYPQASYDTPYPGGDDHYILVHLRQKYHPGKQYRYINDKNGSPLGADTGFITPAAGERFGERIESTTSERWGYIIGADSYGIFIQGMTSVSTSDFFLDGEVVVGAESGASFTVSTSSDDSRSSGSNKFLRIWSDDSDPRVVKTSWTQMHLTDPSPRISDRESGMPSWGGGPYTEQTWVAIELIRSNHRLIARINGAVVHEMDTTFKPVPEGVKIHPYMIGWNANSSSYSMKQETYIDDVYWDHSTRRVYLADASTLDAATKLEIQHPTSWNPNEVRLRGRLKTLDRAVDNIWLIYAEGPFDTYSVQINNVA